MVTFTEACRLPWERLKRGTGGFFNNIPGTALIHCEDPVRGFKFVSFTWVDWKTFEIHEDPTGDCPELISDFTGDPITCRGFIRGV